MPKNNNQSFSQMYLSKALEGEVKAWVDQGWTGVTQTTLKLFNYWFDRGEDVNECFHPCQRRAIETIVYCCEILKAGNLAELFGKAAPEALLEHLLLKQEVETIPFPKYALKMATGSGKTWVLAALVIWQYFNKINNEEGSYSYRFLVVTPGHEVLNRLLDSFKGKRDIKTGNRNPEKSDYKKTLFIPDGARWRDQFRLEILEPTDVQSNTTPPDGPFVFITNWQQFRLKNSEQNLWAQYTGEDVEDMPRGEIILDFRAERYEPEGTHRRGEIKSLSVGQKLLLEIGRLKMEQLAREFRKKGLEKKPVMMVLCEDTKVADLTKDHFAVLTDENGRYYDDNQVMMVHSDLSEAKHGATLENARKKLDKIDIDGDPLRVVISVLMLREGFDLTAKKAEIAQIIDDYVSGYCFGELIDFTKQENYSVLNYVLVFDHVVQAIHKAIIKLIEGYKYEIKGTWGKLSEVSRIMVRESKSIETDKSIYPRIGYQIKGGGFERDFMLEALNPSAEVLSYSKLDRRHRLKITYRDHTGILRNYEVDFIVKTKDKMYLVETKADRDISSPNVAVKVRAAMAWCEQASTVSSPANFEQPQGWEYLILSEGLFKNNQGLGFNAFTPLCRGLREQIIAQAKGTLFV